MRFVQRLGAGSGERIRRITTHEAGLTDGRAAASDP